MPYLAQILNNRTNVFWINFVFLPMAFLVPLRVKFLKEQVFCLTSKHIHLFTTIRGCNTSIFEMKGGCLKLAS